MTLKIDQPFNGRFAFHKTAMKRHLRPARILFFFSVTCIVVYIVKDILEFVQPTDLSQHHPVLHTNLNSNLYPVLHTNVNYNLSSHMQKLYNVDILHNRRPPYKIMLMTSYRSGSSFVGQILKRIPNSFYTFEPLMFLNLGTYKISTEDTIITPNLVYYLQNIFSCNFSVLALDTYRYFPQHSQKRDHWLKNYSFPGHFTFEDAERNCRTKENIVAKVIRAYYLKDVVSLLKSNFYIINLIRDPRGKLTSALILDTKKKYDNITAYLQVPENRELELSKLAVRCEKYRTNIDFIKNVIDKTDELRSRYIFVRYEDFALHPVDMTNRMYKYFGFGLTDEMHSWLNETTSSTAGNEYAITRDSVKTASAWRGNMPYSFIKDFQQICGDVIEAYGYKLVTSEVMQYDCVYSVVSDIPDYFHHL